MTEGIMIALITGGMAIFSNVIVAWAQNSKTVYRIDQLEKKMEKHNGLVERMAIEEQNTKAIWRRVDEIREQIKEDE